MPEVAPGLNGESLHITGQMICRRGTLAIFLMADLGVIQAHRVREDSGLEASGTPLDLTTEVDYSTNPLNTHNSEGGYAFHTPVNTPTRMSYPNVFVLLIPTDDGAGSAVTQRLASFVVDEDTLEIVTVDTVDFGDQITNPIFGIDTGDIVCLTVPSESMYYHTTAVWSLTVDTSGNLSAPAHVTDWPAGYIPMPNAFQQFSLTCQIGDTEALLGLQVLTYYDSEHDVYIDNSALGWAIGAVVINTEDPGTLNLVHFTNHIGTDPGLDPFTAWIGFLNATTDYSETETLVGANYYSADPEDPGAGVFPLTRSGLGSYDFAWGTPAPITSAMHLLCNIVRLEDDTVIWFGYDNDTALYHVLYDLFGERISFQPPGGDDQSYPSVWHDTHFVVYAGVYADSGSYVLQSQGTDLLARDTAKRTLGPGGSTTTLIPFDGDPGGGDGGGTVTAPNAHHGTKVAKYTTDSSDDPRRIWFYGPPDSAAYYPIPDNRQTVSFQCQLASEVSGLWAQPMIEWAGASGTGEQSAGAPYAFGGDDSWTQVDFTMPVPDGPTQWRPSLALYTQVDERTPAVPSSSLYVASNGLGGTRTSIPLPAGTQVGDLLVLTMHAGAGFGDTQIICTDPRIIEQQALTYDFGSSWPENLRIGWGYATDLSDLVIAQHSADGNVNTTVSAYRVTGDVTSLFSAGSTTHSTNIACNPAIPDAETAILAVVGGDNGVSLVMAGDAPGWTTDYGSAFPRFSRTPDGPAHLIRSGVDVYEWMALALAVNTRPEEPDPVWVVEDLEPDTDIYLDCIYIPENGKSVATEPYLDGDQPYGIWEGPQWDATSVLGEKPDPVVPDPGVPAHALSVVHLSDSDGDDGYDGTYSYGLCEWDDTHVVFAYSEDDNYNRNVVQLVEIASDGTLNPLTTLAYKDESILGSTSDVDTSQYPPSVIRTGDLLVVLDNKGLQTFTISGSTITQVGTDDALPFAGPLGSYPASFCQIVAWDGGDLLYGTQYGASVTTGQAAFGHWTGSAWAWGSTYVHPDSHFDGAGNSMSMSRLSTATDPTAVVFRSDSTLTGTDTRLGVLTGSYPAAPTYADGPVTALSNSWSPDELQPSASGDILHVGVSDFTHNNWAWTAEIISPDGSGNITISAEPVVLLPTAFYGDGWSITTKQDGDGTYWVFLTRGSTFGDHAANVYHLAADGSVLNTYPLPDEGDGGPNYNEMSWNVSALVSQGFVSGYYTYSNALMYGLIVGVPGA